MLMAFAFADGLSAQSVITPLGGDAVGSTGSVSFTCGEVAVQRSEARAITVVNITEYFTEGVQQAFADSRNALPTPLPFSVKVYPNPILEWVEIDVDRQGSESSLNYMVYDLHGQTVAASSIEGDNARINLGEYPAGTYLLRIETNDRTKSNVYKIIKAK